MIVPVTRPGCAASDRHARALARAKGSKVADKTVINLATGLEDAERVLIAFLVAGAAVDAGRPTVMFLTKDAVHLALPGHAPGVPCEGCPPIERLFQQYSENGGEFLVCPVCLNARGLEGAGLVA